MKVTLTDKGVTYIRQLALDSMGESHTCSGQKYSLAALNPLARTHTSFRLGSNVSFRSASLATPLLDTLLPAMLATNPPRQVEIHQPKIAISPTFQKRYLVTQQFSPNSTFNGGFGRSLRGADPPGIRRPLDPKHARLRLLKTLQAFSKMEKPRLAQVEDMATTLISKTLRYNKLVERQEAVRKRRNDILLLHRDMIKKTEIEDTIELDGKTQCIEKINAVERMQQIRDTKRERYIMRLKSKHRAVERIWGREKSLLSLAASIKRKVPYMKLGNMQGEETAATTAQTG